MSHWAQRHHPRSHLMLARIQKAMKEKDEGFTLIELLVVIIIIGILAAIAIPVFLNQRKKATEASVKSDLRTVANEMETYYTDNQSYPSITAVAAGGSAVVGGTTVTLSKKNVVSTVSAPAGGKYCLKGNNTDDATTIWYYNSAGGGVTKTACT